MATPQKVFLENAHFWVLPLLLAFLKFLFDILPKPVFLILFGLAVGGVYSFDKYRAKQEELAAIELEKSADQFLDELTAEEKARQEKENQKRALKEKQKESRLRNQEQQRVRVTSFRKRRDSMKHLWSDISHLIPSFLSLSHLFCWQMQRKSSSRDASSKEKDDDDEDDDAILARIAKNRKN